MLQISHGTAGEGMWRSLKSNNLRPNFTFRANQSHTPPGKKKIGVTQNNHEDHTHTHTHTDSMATSTTV